MSAFGGEVDITRTAQNVRYWSLADILLRTFQFCFGE
jgi:hypothetical protein